MADGKITIDTAIDNKGVDKGLKETQSKLNQFKNKMKAADFAQIAGKVAAIGIAFKAVSTAVKTAVKNVQEMEAAYKKQKTAEVQLDNAIKNSPLLNSESSKRLKDFASGLQKISTTGDEELLPFITQLINSGRTEQEAMDIMTVATDIAASGMMDLSSAVSALNMTMQGNAGTLGRQISSIKNLTAEELKQGKAIEILKKQFAGTAAEVAETTGSAEQLKNAWGDLREEMGAEWEKPLSKVRKWIQNIIDKTSEALRLKRELAEAEEANETGKGTTATLKLEIESLKQKREAAKAELEAAKEKAKGKGLTSEDIFEAGGADVAASNYAASLDLLVQKYAELVSKEAERTKQLSAMEAAEKKAAEAAKKAAADKTEADAAAEATNKYNEIIANRDATINKIKMEAELMGEEADAQAILNAEMAAYLEIAATPRLLTKTKEHYELVKKLVEKQKEQKQTAEELAAEEAKKNDFQEALKSIELERDKSDILREQLDLLDQLNEAFINSSVFAEMDKNEKLRIASEYAQKRKQLEKDITEAEKQEGETQKETLSGVMDTISDMVSKMTETINQITDTAKERAESETELKQTQLKKQFADGLISEKEYYEGKEKLEKEAAKKQYEIQMWEWSSSIIQIGINTAQAITKALSDSGTMGIVMASLVGAMGAAQLAAAIANKPIAPHFANGGIVPGTSYSGDRITANVNSGEMVLNSRQQLALWKTANGQGAGGSNMNVQIKNYASNDTQVTPKITEEGLILTVRKIVSDDLQNRNLNSALLYANNTMNGIHYEN